MTNRPSMRAWSDVCDCMDGLERRLMEADRAWSDVCDYMDGLERRLMEADLEIGRLRTALENVWNYSNDPAVVKMVRFALDQTPVTVSNGDRDSE